MARSKAIPKLPFQLHGNALARWGSGNTLPCLKVPSRRPESQTVRGGRLMGACLGPPWGAQGGNHQPRAEVQPASPRSAL